MPPSHRAWRPGRPRRARRSGPASARGPVGTQSHGRSVRSSATRPRRARRPPSPCGRLPSAGGFPAAPSATPAGATRRRARLRRRREGCNNHRWWRRPSRNGEPSTNLGQNRTREILLNEYSGGRPHFASEPTGKIGRFTPFASTIYGKTPRRKIQNDHREQTQTTILPHFPVYMDPANPPRFVMPEAPPSGSPDRRPRRRAPRPVVPPGPRPPICPLLPL